MASCADDLFQHALLKSLQSLDKAGLEIKEKQYEALSSVVRNNNDTICVLPTGYGKSLIYQLLPFMFDFYLPCQDNDLSGSSSSFVLVLSPLNALMIDQISKLRDNVNVSIMKATDNNELKETRSSGESFFTTDSKIIFAHPEALLEDKKVFDHLLKSKKYKENLKAIVVDEAHLISEWSSFRPCYGKIGMLGSLFPDVAILALTATATKQRKKEIASSLGMHNPVIVESNPDRPNIFFESKQRSSKGEDKLLPILQPLIDELKAKRLLFPLTLIYGSLATISDCYVMTSRMLGPLQYEPIGSCSVAANRMFTLFHAEYPDHERERIVTELVAGTSILRLLFVTVAFGIGIDVQNIRRVIHIGVPHTMEEFVQEAGRCGRDGLQASSTVYYNNHDISSQRKICQEMVDYVTSDDVCKRKKILSHFGYSVPKSNVSVHLCCDVHAKTCDCDECLLAAASKMLETVSCADDQEKEIASRSTELDQSAPPQLSSEKKKLLRKNLLILDKHYMVQVEPVLEV